MKKSIFPITPANSDRSPNYKPETFQLINLIKLGIFYPSRNECFWWWKMASNRKHSIYKPNPEIARWRL